MTFRLAAPLVSILLLAACQDAAAPAVAPRSTPLASFQQDNDVEFSFVVVGCNRVDKADVDLVNNPSTANVEQLNRTFSEVAALRPAPQFLFMAGDLVYGYTSDTVALASQLKAWVALYKASPLAHSKTRLIPVSGNHEVQDGNKVAQPANEHTWLRAVQPFIADYAGNGPGVGGPDALQTDQSSLTYSFNFKGTHFVVLNTDPAGKDWSVPVKWVESDLATATSQHAKHIVAIGHKPAIAYPIDLYIPPLTVEDGLGKLYPALRDEFWQALNDNHAEAMLAAHDHVNYGTQTSVGNTWQIIAGNGGSILETVQSTHLNFFGFTVVTMHKDGRVTATSYGRDVPAAGYMAPSDAYPTTIRATRDITWH